MRIHQMKKLAVSTIAAAAMFAATAPAAQAATANSGAFDVNITLTSACTVTTPGNLAFTYTSLGPAATATSPFDIACTTSLPYTVAVSGAAVTDDVVNLAYTLAVTAPAGGGIGTGAAQAYSIDGTIAAGQAGTCAGASCINTLATNKSKTVTVTY